LENKIENVIFLSIKSLFGEDSLLSEKLSEKEISALYALSKKHDAAHLVGMALERQGLLPKESEIAKKFKKQQMIAMLRQERMDYELSEIRRVFEEAGIRFLPLKGAVLRSLYPAPWLRTSCDIDVLVDEEALDACVTLLCERLGYEAENQRNYHDISLHAPSGVHLELHFSILEHMAQIDGELSRVWEFATPISEGAFEHRLTNEYLLFHTVAHMAYHFRHGGCGIRPLLDLFLVHEKLTVDEAVLRAHLSACSLEAFYESVVALSRVWFGDAEPTELTAAMQEFLLSGGVYGSLENRVSVAQGVQGSKKKYLLRRIFLPYDDLCLQYPVLRKHRLLTPICEVRRWFRILFGGRVRRSVREIRISTSLSEEKLDRTSELMAKIGLNK
jgi:hypothetical protein